MPLRFALALCALPAAALADTGPFEGDYALLFDGGPPPAEGCARASDLRLTVAAGELRYVGTTCRLRDPVRVIDMPATLFRAACAEPGGEEGGPYRVLLHREADGGLTVVQGGRTARFGPCPSGRAAPPPRGN